MDTNERQLGNTSKGSAFPRRFVSIGVHSRFLACTWISLVLAGALEAQEKINFQDHVLPLIENHCGRCHNPDKKKGDLDMSTYSALMTGGGSGKVVVAGDPEGSKLHRAVNHLEEPNMPPNKPKLPDKELEVFKRWIAGGLLESSGSKAVAAAKPAIDLALGNVSIGKPDGPPPMPGELCLEPVLRTRGKTVITALAASPWAPLAALGAQKQILLYHTQPIELLGILSLPEGQPAVLKFSGNGRLLIAGTGHGGKSGQVVVWEIATGKRLLTAGKEYDTVLACDLSPDLSRIALGGPERLVKIYSTKDNSLLAKIKKHTDWVMAIAFSPNGEMLASGDRNGGITLWDTDSAQELSSLNGHKGGITMLSWRADSKAIASASEDGTIKIWDAQEGKQARTWNAHNGGVLAVDYSMEGKLVSCGRDNQLTSWDANGTKIRSFESLGETGIRAVFGHDGTYVVASDLGGRVRLFETAKGKSTGELEANPRFLAEQLKQIKEQLVALEKSTNAPGELVSLNEKEVRLQKAQSFASLYRTREQLEELKMEEVRRVEAMTALEAGVKDLGVSLPSIKDAARTREVTEELKTKKSMLTKSKISLTWLRKKIASGENDLQKFKAGYDRLKAGEMASGKTAALGK